MLRHAQWGYGVRMSVSNKIEGGLSQWMEQRADMALSFLSSVLGTSKGLDYMEPLPAGVHRNWSCSGQTSPGGHLAVTEDVTDRHGVEVLPPSNRSYSVYRSLPSTTQTQNCPATKAHGVELRSSKFLTVMMNSIVPIPMNTGTSLILDVHIRAQEKKKYRPVGPK